jgi:AsmA protein
MKLTGSKMPVPELAAILPALGVVLPSGSSLQGGTATANLTLQGPADQIVSAGSVSLNQTRLTGFDLGSKLNAIAAITGIQAANDTTIETFSADVRRSPEGTSAEAITLIVPSIGDLSGAGTISPAHALDFKMRAKLHTSGNVMAALGQKGDTTIPFFIRGTESEPAFIPDLRGIAEEKVNTFLKGEDPAKAAKGLLDRFFGRKKPN